MLAAQGIGGSGFPHPELMQAVVPDENAARGHDRESSGDRIGNLIRGFHEKHVPEQAVDQAVHGVVPRGHDGG